MNTINQQSTPAAALPEKEVQIIINVAKMLETLRMENLELFRATQDLWAQEKLEQEAPEFLAALCAVSLYDYIENAEARDNDSSYESIKTKVVNYGNTLATQTAEFIIWIAQLILPEYPFSDMPPTTTPEEK